MAFQLSVKRDATNVTVPIMVVDSTDGTPETGYAYDTAGIDLWYRRGPTGAETSITEATQTVTGAHSDGGVVHVSDGRGRLDLPDAAVASGVDWVEYGGTITGMIVIGGFITLESAAEESVRTLAEAFMPTNTPTAFTGNTTSLVNLTGILDSSATADDINGELLGIQYQGGTYDGLAIQVRVTDYAVTNQLASVEKLDGTALDEAVASGDYVWRLGQFTADVVSVKGTDQTAGDLGADTAAIKVVTDTLADFGTAIISGTAQTGTLSTTVATTDLTGYVNDELIGRTIIFITGTATGQSAVITDYASASGTVTYSTIATAPANNDTFIIL